MSCTDRNDEQRFEAAGLLSALRASHAVRRYPPKRTIFAQGDAADAVFYLEAGQVKLSLSSPRGKDAVIGIVAAGEFFGEHCLGGSAERLSRATAITASSVIRIEKDAMLRTLRDEPRFSQMFIAHLLARNIRIEEDLVDQLINSSEKRLARALLLLAKFDTGEPSGVNVSQATLAAMIGTTRSRISYFMNKFRRLGYIEIRNGIRVTSSLLNVTLQG